MRNGTNWYTPLKNKRLEPPKLGSLWIFQLPAISFPGCTCIVAMYASMICLQFMSILTRCAKTQKSMPRNIKIDYSLKHAVIFGVELQKNMLNFNWLLKNDNTLGDSNKMMAIHHTSDWNQKVFGQKIHNNLLRHSQANQMFNGTDLGTSNICGSFLVANLYKNTKKKHTSSPVFWFNRSWK